MKTVTIRECKIDGRTWTHHARTNDRWDAIDRAIARHFGKAASFHRDLGITHGLYGQVARYVPKANASTTLTGRVRIEVE